MCLQNIIKILLFCANFLFALAGIALITVGSISVSNFNKLDDAIPEDYNQLTIAPILTITIGCIIFIIAFLGCCGAINNNICMLTTYSVILLVLLLIQIGIGIFAFLEIKDQDDLYKKINTTIEKIYNNPDKNKNLITVIQEELACCGYKGEGTINPSTCLSNQPACNVKFFDFVHGSINSIAITLLALGLTEILGTVFSLCVANEQRNTKRRTYA